MHRPAVEPRPEPRLERRRGGAAASMSIAGTRIGGYPVERELGRGGMGVVYLARDPRLDRAVAIKMLPDAFAHDPERLARFEREAKVLASLSHPNIAGIYGIEEADGRRFLTLQFIEGETLAQRIGRGRLPVGEALEVCRQIAAALEAAHEGGVIHRDLKPGNVKITPAGEVKVLDFGLAKGGTASESGSDPDLSHSPTLAYAATGVGVILGTAAYMSPEQARGRLVDKRTDIWSFGCVLYECLNGQQLFAGETVSDTIAKILEREPDWNALPAGTPRKVHELLRRCLDKDAKRRLRDIGDARIELEEALAERSSASRAAASTAARGRVRSAGPLMVPALAVGLVVGAIAGVVLWNWIGPGRRVREHAKVLDASSHLSFALPSDIRFNAVQLSPDGSSLVAVGRPRESGSGEEPQSRIYTRRLNGYEVKPLSGTEGAFGFRLYEDGQSLVFVGPIARGATKNKIARVPIDGSAPPITLGDWKDNWDAPAVLHNGEVLATADQGAELVRIPAAGGAAGPAIKVDAGGFRGTLSLVRALPGDKAVLVNGIAYGSRGWYYNVGLLNPKSGKVRFIIEDAGNASYSPSGHLLFTRGDVLLAAPFDLSRLETTASPVPILSGLLTRFTTEPAVFQLADNGTLLYTPGGRTFSARRLAIVDAGGNVKPWSDERRPFLLDPSVSRDGRRFACVITNAQGIDEIWVSDVDRPALRRVVAIPDADCDFVALSPDGEWIAFARTGRNEKDGIYVQRADGQGSDRRVVKLPDPSAFEGPQCWTPDGASLVIADIVGGRSHLRLVPSVLTAEHEVQPTPLVRGFVGEFQGALSPDGHTLAFASNESGKNEVYACAYRADGTVSDPVRVSSGGGSAPHWSLDGKTLLYLADQSRLMSATVSTAPALTAGAPIQKLDLGKLRIASFAVLPEGRLLGVLQGEDERDEVTGGNVVLNFSDELERKVGRRRR